jgi:glycosyltransferase involved in cell wall biosynthesis
MVERTREGPENARVTVSLVVPIFDEDETIDPFLQRAERVLADLGEPHEIIFVDDGSRDGSLERLLAHRRRNSAIKIVSLSRNFGKDLAMTAGLDYALGEAVIIIDVDLQDPPELIPELIAKWRDGNDVVYAQRTSRGSDTATKRLTASWFYRIHNNLANINIPNETGDFRLMDRRVVQAISGLSERDRFMKGLFTWVGFRQAEVGYERDERVAGTSKWDYWRLWNFALDGITSFSTVPLRVWSYVGATISIFAFAYALFLVFLTLISGADVPGYASLMVVVLLLGGVNLLSLGIIGEYLGRTYMEVKNRPLYIVRERHGFDGPGPRDD